jgi:hypothetical protein
MSEPPEPERSRTPGEEPPVDPHDTEEERLKAFNRRESDSAWRSVAYLLTGPLVYGGLGYLADLWLGTSWLVGVGIVGGMALSLYLIWFRYGTH